MTPQTEIYISVDVETAGPYPARYSMLSIGACLVSDPSVTFYAELQPLSSEFLPEAMAIGGLSLEVLKRTGMAPAQAMLHFAAWIEQVVPPGARPVFAAFNAPFDWSFVNHYFHEFLGYNPFGHNGVDIKAFYMGMTGVPWAETSLPYVTARLGGSPALSHNALDDAVDQGTLFNVMLESRKHSEPR